MKTWKQKKLGETKIKFIDGDRSNRYPSRDEFLNFGILFLNAESIKTGKINQNIANRISRLKYDTIIKGRIQCNDVLMTTRGNGIGDVALVDINEHGLINAQMLILRSNKIEINSRYLYYFLKCNSTKEQIVIFSSGSAQPQIPIRDLKHLPISLPPLPIQKKIAAVLSAYDDLIENNNRRIALLEKMAEELYREWFVRLRFPGHDNVKVVKGVPEGWEVKPFIEMEDVHFIKNKLKPFDHEKNYYATSEVNGIELGEPTEIITYNNKPSRAQYSPVINSIWFARMKNTYKVLSFAESNNEIVSDTVLSSGFVGFKTNKQILAYLFCLIKSDVFHEIKDLYTTGATQESLTNDGLTKIKIIHPEKSIIKKFGEIHYPTLNEILHLQKRNKKLKIIRDRLLSRLMSGKIDTENLDIRFPKSMMEEEDNA